MNNLSPLNTAVLFITYKRLDTTIQVFETIRKVKPPRLYISSNYGNDEEENKRVQKVRIYLKENIDWKCTVKKLYRNEHLSAKLSISGAIDWFFENEEMGIILEDDCLPSQSFFIFCEYLLNKYKNDTRFASISGNNFSKIAYSNDSYFFSRYSYMWGWASWKSSWEAHKKIMQNFDKIIPSVKSLSINNRYANSRIINNAIRANSGKIDTWDLQWILSNYLNNKLIFIPRNNLVKNIGYDSDATNTKVNNPAKIINNYEIKFPLSHPLIVVPNYDYDEYLFKHVFHWKPFYRKLFEFSKLPQRIVNKLN